MNLYTWKHTNTTIIHYLIICNKIARSFIIKTIRRANLTANFNFQCGKMKRDFIKIIWYNWKVSAFDKLREI